MNVDLHVCTSTFHSGAIEENMLVRAGTSNSLSGGIVVPIARVTKHPDYLETPRSRDIAVVQLELPLGMTNTIDFLYLPSEGTYIPDGTETKVVSWGFEYVSRYIVPFDSTFLECFAG